MLFRYPDASWHPWFATFGNHHNTYSASDAPERIDYLMYWAAPHVAMCTLNFTMPMYTTKNRKGDIVSLSGAYFDEFFLQHRWFHQNDIGQLFVKPKTDVFLQRLCNKKKLCQIYQGLLLKVQPKLL